MLLSFVLPLFFPQFTSTAGTPLELIPKEKSWGNSYIRFELIPGRYTKLYGNEIGIHSINTIVNILKARGFLIQRLSFDGYQLSPTEALRISQHIEENASDSLIDLRLIDIDGVDYLLADTNTTFTDIKSLEITRGFYTDNLRLHQIFPKLEELFFTPTNDSQIQSIQRHYKELQHLAFYSLNYDNVNLQPLLQLNPQLQRLSLNTMPNLATLQCIDDNLPNLSTLDLQCAWHGCSRPFENLEPIHLNYVQNFIISIGDYVPYNIPITFDRLESLDIDAKEFRGSVVQLIRENRHVKALSLPIFEPADFKCMVEIVRELPALREITFTWSEGVATCDQLVMYRLLTKADKLNVIKFRMETGDNFEKLTTLIPNEWQLDKRDEIYLRNSLGLEFVYVRRMNTFA